MGGDLNGEEQAGIDHSNSLLHLLFFLDSLSLSVLFSF